MSTTIDLTVGDNGVTISGTITQKLLGTLSDLTGYSVKFSLLRVNGQPIVVEAAATLGTPDAPNNSAPVSYRLQATDVANAEAQAYVRWTLVLPDGGKIHFPGAKDQQTFVRINA